MKKLTEFFKRLWRLITGQEIRPYIPENISNISNKKVLTQSNNYDIDIDYTDIYDVISNCKTTKGLQKECSKYAININTDITNFTEDKTTQLKVEYLHQLIKELNTSIKAKYDSLFSTILAKVKVLRDLRIKDLRLKGLNYDSNIDYVDIYEVLIKCRDIKEFEKICKSYGFTINSDITHYSENKTAQLKIEELFSLFKLYAQGLIKPYKETLEKKIEEFEILKGKRIEELRNQGLLCPKCNTKQEIHYTGLIKWDINVKCSRFRGAGLTPGSETYQFHYKKCSKCGEWKMFEYREVPSWWDDLLNKDCPFKQGDMIQEISDKWKSGEMQNTKQYASFKILRW